MQTLQLRSSSHPGADEGAAAQGDVWIDIDIGDDEGRHWLTQKSGLDDQVIGKMLEPAPATYWRRHGRGLHFHVRTPVPGADTATPRMIDFGFWLEPGRIITLRRGGVPALDRASEACAAGAGPTSSWRLLIFVLTEALSRLEQTLHDLTATIDQLEDEVVHQEGEPPIHRLVELQKRLVYARRYRVPLANLIGFTASQSGSDIDGALRDELDGFANLVTQQQELLDLSIERASALQSQIRDQLADSLNTATYRFTWVATVFLPLSFLTGLLGINVAGIPGDHDPLAFWLVCGALCVIAAAWGIAVGRLTRRFRRSGGP